MTAETRRNIFRYGIAIDLVILATGIGLVWPEARLLLGVAYVAAVVLSVWKGGWKAGALALVLSLAGLAYLFPTAFAAPQLVAFAATSAALGALLLTMQRRMQPAVALPEPVPEPVPQPFIAPNVITFDRDFAERPLVRAEEPPVAVEPEAAVETPVEPPVRKRTRTSRRNTQQREEAERLAREAREAEEAREREAQEAREREAQEAREREAQEAREREAQEAREREEEARRAAAEALRLAEEERRAAEERAAKEREEAERLEREAREQAAAARAAAAEELRLAEEAHRAAVERAAKEREEAERIERETRERVEAERLAAEETARTAFDEQRLRLERETAERLEAEKRAAEERLAAEREALRAEHERTLAAEREALERELAEQLAAARAAQPVAVAVPVELPAPVEAPPPPVAAAPALAAQPAAKAAPLPKNQPASKGPGLFGAITSWFRKDPSTRSLNLKTKKISTNTRKPSPPAAPRKPIARERHPRLLLFERRRGTADAVTPKLKSRGIDVAVVERWVDAVDELFRFRPDVMLVDAEHPDFDLAYRTIADQNAKLPIVLTGRSAAGFNALPNVRYATFAVRPYDPDELTKIAQEAMANPERLLQQQAVNRAIASMAKPASSPNLTAVPKPSATQTHLKVAPPPAAASKPAAPVVVALKPPTDELYEVLCGTCRVGFDALEADWCSCLTKERTLVCTNCLACFCKAAPAYKEKFWVQAPPRLFERKTAEARRQQSGLPTNPDVDDVKRPLVLCVEDDEEIQAIVQRVCQNLGYGFIYATNGQDGLNLARLYKPNLILSDAFMPKLDGREMCRLLKEEGSDARMVVMTGLYTDTKYRSEAVKRFHVDDYVAKPVAITDLINLLQKHLEGVTGLPMSDDLYEQHRRDVEAHQDEEYGGNVDYDAMSDEEDVNESGIALADFLTAEIEESDLELVPGQTPEAAPAPVEKPRVRSDIYPVTCFNCSERFDATKAEWCSCVGRDQTLACTQCGGCFCKAPASYKERFWMDAPPSLFERKMIGSKRNLGARSNPAPDEVKRPLILLVEDDENVQLIVRTVVTSMGYGFIAGANGQEGLSLAREYNPELILSDAFMPKLDGREMCRLLKEDPATSRSKAIIMTGLYTDRKYRNEALDYFKVDDYVAKPLAVDDLIKLFKKHLPIEVQAAS
jgi:CheY-like chemotaxis protein